MVKAKQTKKQTPSSRRLQVSKRRGQKQVKRRKQDKKPSWQDALKRKYVAAAGGVKAKPWDHSRSEKKRSRDDDAEGEDAMDIDDAEDDFGVNPESGMEIQDDVDEDREKRLNEKQPMNTQLFVKGLPTDMDDEALTKFFGRFGKIRRVFVVKNHMTKMPTGSAFVHFADGTGADQMYEHAQQNVRELKTEQKVSLSEQTDGMTKHQAKMVAHKLKQDTVVSSEPFMHVGTTRATVYRAMARSEATEFTASMHKAKKDKKKRTPTGADDPRNLYLLQEGLVVPDTPAAQGLQPRVLGLLQRDYETRKQQLRNVNYYVSKTRLSLRNLPRTLEDKDLRQLVLEPVRAFLKAHPEDKMKSKWSKHGPLKQCRVLKDGDGRGKGFAFVEFYNHNVALAVLRQLNNNPTVYGKNQRPVVHFAVENSNAIQKMARTRELKKNRMQIDKAGFYDKKE